MKKPKIYSVSAFITRTFAVFFISLIGAATLSAKTLKVNVNAGNQALPDYETNTTFIKVDLQVTIH